MVGYKQSIIGQIVALGFLSAQLLVEAIVVKSNATLACQNKCVIFFDTPNDAGNTTFHRLFNEHQQYLRNHKETDADQLHMEPLVEINAYITNQCNERVLADLKQRDKCKNVLKDQVIAQAAQEFSAVQFQDTLQFTKQVSPSGRLVETPIANWALDMADGLLDNQLQIPQSAGSGVQVYVMDTGVNLHQDLPVDRVFTGINLVPYEDSSDQKGHGTFNAGLIAGSINGVAKNAMVISVKILDSQSLGSTSLLLAGLNYIKADHLRRVALNGGRPVKSVVNLSIQFQEDPMVNQIIQGIIQLGVVVVAAAGNQNDEACKFLPGNLPNVITVGALAPTQDGTSLPRAEWSNSGQCVTVWAPGQDLLSAYYLSNNQVAMTSGTSQSAALVSGMVAVILGDMDVAQMQPQQIVPIATEKLLQMSSHNSIQIPNSRNILAAIKNL
ncbi:hypothetical protein MIR68_008902 [Amoeboaphelidium protococcarum]|nr:hypothetical protein MIR68_008902 [Amoeboaphelidium protococcarum]